MMSYTEWFNKLIKFIYDHYDCTIRYPDNINDVGSTLDGLQLDFNRADVHVKLSNMSIYNIFITETRNRNYYRLQYIKEMIDNLILNNFRKEY